MLIVFWIFLYFMERHGARPGRLLLKGGKHHGYLRAELHTMCSKNWKNYKVGS